MSEVSRVLGIDTSLRSTGVAVVEAAGSKMRAVEQMTLKVGSKKPVSFCLARIHDGINEIIDKSQPHAVSIEGIFYCKNVKTAVTLGEARGVAIAVCASRELPVHEYSPRRVKQAVVGFGSAAKGQVRKMVMSILSLSQEPQEDAGDALALAICHLHNWTGHEALRPDTI